jgi:hypothetical protein
MSNRALGHAAYFKVLKEIEREIAENGDYAYNRVSRVVDIDARTVKAFVMVGMRAVPTRNRLGLPPIKDVIQGTVPRPEGAPELRLANGEVPNPLPPSPINRCAIRPAPAAPPPAPEPEPIPPPPPIQLPEFPTAPAFPEPGDFPAPPAPPAPEPHVTPDAVEPPSAPPPAAPSSQNLMTEIMRQSERYIEKREFQEIATKHIRDGARALDSSLTAAEGVQISCTKMLAAIQPALDRLEYDVTVRLNNGERIPARELIDLVQTAAKASQAMAAGMKAVLEAKQLLLGGPTEIIRHSTQAAPVEGVGQKSDSTADAFVESLLSGKLLPRKDDRDVIDVSVTEASDEPE